MQNRYVGDVGDFAKYALLRAIVSSESLRLGVIWFLFGNEEHNSDGRHTGYLARRELHGLDPELHDSLRGIVDAGVRNVAEVRTSEILGGHTLYHESLIGPINARGPARRLAHRDRWLAEALAATSSADVVFFDPDNGLEVLSVPRHTVKAGKYVYWDELRSFWNRGQSLIVYHHLNRSASVAAQGQLLRDRFSKKFPEAAMLRRFLFRRGSCRHFWIIGQAEHVPALERQVEALLASGWDRYLEPG